MNAYKHEIKSPSSRKTPACYSRRGAIKLLIIYSSNSLLMPSAVVAKKRKVIEEAARELPSEEKFH
jgi:hypothetical protein